MGKKGKKSDCTSSGLYRMTVVKVDITPNISFDEHFRVKTSLFSASGVSEGNKDLFALIIEI